VTKSQKPFLRALAGETLATPPIWFMRQAGRYLPEYRATRSQAGGFLNLCYNPELAEEVTLQPLRRYGFDAAILFADILVIPDALGQTVTFQAGEGPVLTPLSGEADIAALDVSKVTARLAPIFETLKRLSRSIPDTTALIGFCGAPWTVATYMIEGGGSKDYAETKRWAYGNPDLFQKLIDVLVEASAAYLNAQIAAGAEAVQVFDSWAGVLPEAEFRRWVIAPTARLVDKIRAAHPGVPVIGFPRGAGVLYPDFARETQVDAVSLDPTIPPGWARDHIQPICTVQGNLDPVHLITGGEAMDAAIDHIVETLRQGPFVFNLGHGITPATPPENVARAVERVRMARG